MYIHIYIHIYVYIYIYIFKYYIYIFISQAVRLDREDDAEVLILRSKLMWSQNLNTQVAITYLYRKGSHICNFLFGFHICSIQIYICTYLYQ
jgi:hypothetical protein